MPLAEDFQRIVDSLPPDWTQLELDLRIADEERYIETATLLTQINAMPYSKHDWHWRLRVAHEFGHAAAPETTRGTLALWTASGSRASWWRARLARAESRCARCGAVPSRCARSSPAAVTNSVARIALLCPDLLFGSKVEGALGVAGHTVNRFAAEDEVRTAASFHDLLIVDLTAEGIDGPALVTSMRERGELEAVPTLGFYSHVDQDTRARRGGGREPGGAALADGAGDGCARGRAAAQELTPPRLRSVCAVVPPRAGSPAQTMPS